MNVSPIGSHVTLLFQTKYQTFTPDQFVKTFQDQGFTQSPGVANISANPMAQPVQTNIFSKENLIVLFNPNENLIIFQVINTLDFNDIYENEIQKILVNLNFNPSSVGMLGIDSATQVHEVDSPIDNLKSLTNSNFIQGLSNLGIVDGFDVTSLRLKSKSSKDESFAITIEPLQSNPTGSYQMILAYRTKDNNKFNEFVKKFGTNMIEAIVKEIENNV